MIRFDQDGLDAENAARAARGPFPRPKCPTCGNQSRCRVRRPVRDVYPRCHRPLLGTSLPRVADLLAWWSRFHHCDGDSRLDHLKWALLTRLATDRLHFSEIFEPSCSRDSSGWHFWRFSYAFPGFRCDPAAAIHDALEMCRPFGDELRSQTRTLLSPALEAAVCAPLVGLAYDTPTSWRVKLYLQFYDDAGSEALRIASRLTGRTDLHRVFGNRHLHLIGIDLGPRGIMAAKLYFMYAQIPSRQVSRVAGPVELIDYLAGAGLEHVNNLLVTHRMHRFDDPDLEHPTEVDFALQDNDLCWEDLAGSQTLRTAFGSETPLAMLESSFPVAVRRVSVSVGRPDKLTLYYAPTEIELEAADVSPADKETIDQLGAALRGGRRAGTSTVS